MECKGPSEELQELAEKIFDVRRYLQFLLEHDPGVHINASADFEEKFKQIDEQASLMANVVSNVRDRIKELKEESEVRAKPGCKQKATKNKLYGFVNDIEVAKMFIEDIQVDEPDLKLIEAKCNCLLKAISKAREVRDMVAEQKEKRVPRANPGYTQKALLDDLEELGFRVGAFREVISTANFRGEPVEKIIEYVKDYAYRIRNYTIEKMRLSIEESDMRGKGERNVESATTPSKSL